VHDSPAAGSGNIATDPQLASVTHLAATSPCIGAGSPANARGADIDGEPWANPPAMGADQPRPGTGELTVQVEAELMHVATATRFPSWPGARVHSAERMGFWRWDGANQRACCPPCLDGSWRLFGALDRLQLGASGRRDDQPGGDRRGVRSVRARHQLEAGLPVFEWATAATTIQEAIGAGTLPGRLVLVTNGVYQSGSVRTNGLNRVALTDPVVVRSVNGPEATVIEGATNQVRCAFVGSGSVLSGFTLMKGRAIAFDATGSGGECGVNLRAW